MQKNLNKILILIFIFLASAGLWAVLFFGIPVGPFTSFGFLNRYKEWSQSQNEVLSVEEREGSLLAMTTFLTEISLEQKEIEGYFIEGDNGRLTLLTSIEEAGRQLGATTTIVSVGERIGELSFFDITVLVRGPFVSVYRFIHTLPALPFIVTVNQANIRLLSDSSMWEGAFQITVQKFNRKTI